MITDVILRPIETPDLPMIAQVHMDAFPESALTKLGPSIVRSYYDWQLNGPHEKVRATAALVTDECAGFSFSGIFNGSTSGFIARYRPHLIRASLRRPQLVFNDMFVARVREGLRLMIHAGRKRRRPPQTVSPQPATNYGILSIAVAPKFQQLGVGQLLMQDAEYAALDSGCRKICLTVHPGNVKAVRFYEKQKWKKLVTAGLWTGAMIKTIR